MATFLNDTFTEASDITLASHVGETGAAWTKHSASGAGTWEVNASGDRARVEGAGTSKHYYASGVPDAADYTITAVFSRVANEIANHSMGVAARMDISADTRYYLIAETFTEPGVLELGKTVAGSGTLLGTYGIGNTSGDYTIEWTLTGTSLVVKVGGVERINVTDSAITAAGRVGVTGFGDTGAGDGWHIASILGATAEAAGPSQRYMWRP